MFYNSSKRYLIYKILFQTYQDLSGLNIRKKKHFSGYSYLGPASRLDIRLNENDQPRQGEEPVSPTDQLALHHDIAYRNAEVNQAKGLINAETAL